MSLYADYNASFPLRAECKDAMCQADLAKLERARRLISYVIDCEPDELVFVSGATESCYLALVGLAYAAGKESKFLTQATEHKAVLETLDFLKKSPFKSQIEICPNRPSGEIDFDAFKSLAANADFISLMAANNETGAILPNPKDFNQEAIVHVDAAQVLGKMSFSFKASGADLCSFSAHKIGGPKGIGALVIKNGTKWKSPMLGGRQEEGRRGGTPAIEAICGFAKACEELPRFNSKARDSFEKAIRLLVPECQINASSAKRLPNTSSLSLSSISSFDLVERLKEKSIFISVGSACSSGKLEPSHVLRAMGKSTTECLSSIRVSFGPEHTESDGHSLAESIAQETQLLRDELVSGLAGKLKTKQGNYERSSM